jgi:hypothetical protein
LPSQPDIHYTLGVTLWQQAVRKGRTELRAATEGKPDYAGSFLLSLGTVLRQHGKLEDAATALRKAISIDPGWCTHQFGGDSAATGEHNRRRC